MLTVTAVRLLPHFGQATGVGASSRCPPMFSLPLADTLSSPLGPFTPHLRRPTERVRRLCKICSRPERRRVPETAEASGLRSRGFDAPPHGGHHFARSHRLVQHACGVQVAERFTTVGDDDDGKIAAGVGGNLLANRGAVDVREDEVEDDRVEGAAFENRQCLDAVSCFTGRISVQGQCNGKQPPEIVVGFDEEDGAWGIRHRPGYLG